MNFLACLNLYEFAQLIFKVTHFLNSNTCLQKNTHHHHHPMIGNIIAATPCFFYSQTPFLCDQYIIFTANFSRVLLMHSAAFSYTIKQLYSFQT